MKQALWRSKTDKESLGERVQREYYARTAHTYEQNHVTDGDEHSKALVYVAQLAGVVGARTVLDVGSGTGRGIRLLNALRPDLQVIGIEPVEALRKQAPLGAPLLGGSGERLPFADSSFDVVIATGVLHHVPDPRRMISEMLRVARRGVMISDSNRFGQGRRLGRAMKSSIYRLGLWPGFMFVRTQGKGYLESEGDGIFYSYSIFDSLPAIQDWAEDAFVIPTRGDAKGRNGAYSNSTHGLLVGLRELTDSPMTGA